MNSNLIEKLRGYIEFNEDEERFINSVFRLKHLAKGEHFLLAGVVCGEAAFIESGVFRFYINTGKRDLTYHFAAENEFICEYPSFLRQVPSDRNIQALEPAQIRVISFDDLQRFYREVVLGERFGRLIAEEIFIDSIQQLASFYKTNLRFVTRNSLVGFLNLCSACLSITSHLMSVSNLSL